MADKFEPLDDFQFDNGNSKFTRWQLIYGLAVSAVIIFAALAILKWQTGGGVNFAAKNTNESVPISDENSAVNKIRIDSDSDLLSDYEEKIFGTNPSASDTDADGYSDFEELIKGYNPLEKEDLLTMKSDNVSSEIQICEKNENVTVKSKCIKKIALQNDDFSICLSLSPTDRGMCYKDIAVKRNNPVYCGNLSDQWTISACYREIALIKIDISLCWKIIDKYQYSSCVAQIAEKSGDASLCRNLKSAYEIRDCQSRTEGWNSYEYKSRMILSHYEGANILFTIIGLMALFAFSLISHLIGAKKYLNFKTEEIKKIFKLAGIELVGALIVSEILSFLFYPEANPGIILLHFFTISYIRGIYFAVIFSIATRLFTAPLMLILYEKYFQTNKIDVVKILLFESIMYIVAIIVAIFLILFYISSQLFFNCWLFDKCLGSGIG